MKKNNNNNPHDDKETIVSFEKNSDYFLDNLMSLSFENSTEGKNSIR